MTRSVAVVGAGVVGLSTAWFLQEHGVKVTVLDRRGVAAGASLGNAGYLTPSLAVPLPEPALLRYGVRAVLDPSSPVVVGARVSPSLMRFLTGFLRHSTHRRWARSMRALALLGRRAFEGFDALADGGVDASPTPAEPFVAAYLTAAERKGLTAELAGVQRAGVPVDFDVVDGDAARRLVPALTTEVTEAVLIRGQRFLHPGRYVQALADAVQSRGGTLRSGVDVTAVEDQGDEVALWSGAGRERSVDSVVLATGAWFGQLGRRLGVRSVVQAGRGYSFSVAVRDTPSQPVYFPAQRIACTPLGDRLRVAGMMEFSPADAPLDRRRIQTMVKSARSLLDGVDWDDRHDEWVGSRPCTADGLPLIGATASPRVFAAAGHGMWGVTLGPITGKLLAEQVATGRTVPELVPFDPCR